MTFSSALFRCLNRFCSAGRFGGTAIPLAILVVAALSAVGGAAPIEPQDGASGQTRSAGPSDASAREMFDLGSAPGGPGSTSVGFGQTSGVNPSGVNPFGGGIGNDFGGGFGFGASQSAEVSWNATYHVVKGGDIDDPDSVLRVAATIAPSWYIYAPDTPTGGPIATTFKVDDGEQFDVGEFAAERKPIIEPESPFGIPIHEYRDTIAFYASIDLDENFDDPIDVTVAGQVCGGPTGSCIPFNETLTARRGESIDVSRLRTDPSAGAATTFSANDYPVSWQAAIRPATVQPGGAAMLEFRASPDDEYHVYQSVTDDSVNSTNFEIRTKSGLLFGAPISRDKTVTKRIGPLDPFTYHVGPAVWRIPISIPDDAEPGSKAIAGSVVYQACQDTSCLPREAFDFVATLNVGEPAPASIELSVAKPTEVLDRLSQAPSWVDQFDAERVLAQAVDADGGSNVSDNLVAEPIDLTWTLLLGLVSGLILNIMPCVLPVIGLKVLSFVSQAGESRSRLFMLNLAYVAGIFIVFGTLAILATAFRLSWGEHFQYFGVRMAAIVALFAFALSFLGVWEVPAPGLSGSSLGGTAGGSDGAGEGLSGAVTKGIFATILATPCGAPLMGGTFAAVLQQPAPVVFAVFMAMALGMSLPYLIIGMFPAAVRWLPKPGQWMVTFKELMAFMMLGAAAFFFYQFNDDNKVPVFITLIGVWLGCWIAGKVPIYATMKRRLTGVMAGAAMASIIGLAAFHYLNRQDDLAWNEYSDARLASLQEEGKTVIVDFSAKWCVNCLVNFNNAIDTPAVAKKLEELDGVAIYAEWERPEEQSEVGDKLKELGAAAIPYMVIYPGDRPDQPIKLDGLLTEAQVLAELERAGPSRSINDDSPRRVDDWPRSGNDGRDVDAMGAVLVGRDAIDAID